MLNGSSQITSSSRQCRGSRAVRVCLNEVQINAFAVHSDRGRQSDDTGLGSNQRVVHQNLLSAVGSSQGCGRRQNQLLMIMVLSAMTRAMLRKNFKFLCCAGVRSVVGSQENRCHFLEEGEVITRLSDFSANTKKYGQEEGHCEREAKDA